jgi:hypothetical protein
MAAVQQQNDPAQIGKVKALTTLSPVKPDQHFAVKFRLDLVGHIPLLTRPLAQLEFIHYARWTLIDHLPVPVGSSATGELNSLYLFFESNYNQSETNYLDAFSGTLPERLVDLWGTCVDFVETAQQGDPRREVVPWAFRQYVSDNGLEVLHFYAAYPEHTMVSVRQAIAVSDLVPGSSARLTKRRSDKLDRRLLPVVLGPLPPRLGKLKALWRGLVAQWRAIVRNFGVDPLMLAIPIEPGRTEEVRCALGKLPRGLDSPLNAVPGVHFARFVLMPRTLKDLGQPARDELENDYLVYTADHKGATDAHYEALREADELKPIWACCAGYSKFAGSDAWFDRHRIGIRYYVPGYPPRLPDEVKRSVEERADLADRVTGSTKPAWPWVS